MKNRIPLYNRYHDNEIYLEPISDNVYKVCMKNVNYISVHYDDSKSIWAIDPEGGPYLPIGFEFENGRKIVNIEYNSNDNYYTIEVE